MHHFVSHDIPDPRVQRRVVVSFIRKGWDQQAGQEHGAGKARAQQEVGVSRHGVEERRVLAHGGLVYGTGEAIKVYRASLFHQNQNRPVV